MNSHDHLRARVLEAKERMADVIETHETCFKGVLREEMGWIAFFWGDDNGGLCHIISKRNREHDKSGGKEPDGLDTLDKLAEVIILGDCYEGKRDRQGQNTKIEIWYNGFLAVISKEYKKEKQAWLLTGFRITSQNKKPSGASVKSESRIDATHPGIRGVSSPDGSGRHPNYTPPVKKNIRGGVL